MKKTFHKKTILITGATGSFGAELLRGLLEFEPKVVRVFSRDETKQFHLNKQLGVRKDVRYFIGDVRDYPRLVHAMEDVDYVFHLAAMKHVVACEYNPFEAMKTNIIGTQNVIEAAIEARVKKVIFTSTDKAANPCNTMGVSKLFAERLTTAAHYFRGHHKTIFCSVRFGNVMGSRGSIIPVVEEQIREGQPVTITDPDMERYVMTLSDCLRLIYKVTELAVGGEVFVLKMPVVRMGEFIDVLIEHFSMKYQRVKKDIAIEYMGKLPGEKLVEELVTEEEMTRCEELEDMYVVFPQLTGLLAGANHHQTRDSTRLITQVEKKFLSRAAMCEFLRQEAFI